MTYTRPHHTLPRLFIESSLSKTQQVVLSDEQTHYLSHVLRLSEGDPVRLFNGRDGEWLAKIVAPAKHKKHNLTLVVAEQTRQQVDDIPLFLMCAPIKKNHFDDMLMKSTEIGVTHIQPILTARTQVREVNISRCQAILTEAAEQSERLAVPTINTTISLENLTKTWPPDMLPIICAEWGKALPPREVFLSLAAQKTAIVTGPEGGFSADELELFHALPKARFLRLGTRILRADTAAIAALSCWQAFCGDWR